MIRLCLFEPDIPQNTGTLMRLCACLAIPLDIVEPCGFSLADKNLKRAGMDYLEHLDMTRHISFNHFEQSHKNQRRILLTTKAKTAFTDFAFMPDDILIVGRESSGVPQQVHEACDAHVIIPMTQNCRSINVAVAASMVLSEALRQCKLYPSKKDIS